MQQKIELTSKLVVAIIGLVSISAILIPTYAVPAITSADIVDNTIQSVDIKNGQVKTEDLASGAVVPKVHVIKGDVLPVDVGGIGSDGVDCPAGEVVTGGGFSSSGGFNVFNSFPSDQDTWHVDSINEGNAAQAFQVYALCIGPAP